MGWQSRGARRRDRGQAMRLAHVVALQRHFGSCWLLERIAYAAKLKTGALRRHLPARAWNNQPLAALVFTPELADPVKLLQTRRAGAIAFFFSPDDRAVYSPLLQSWDKQTSPIQSADALRRGSIRFFAQADVFCGFPPDWHANPVSQQRSPSDHHWSEMGDFDFGDIKMIWEANRFGFAYDLARAYWRTGNELYPEMFWQLVESWRESNSPQLGVNWKCGQEATFRSMAWCFALYAFLSSPATTAERVGQLVQMLAVTAARIEANINYALSQQNNHGISEAVGLWTIGLLFPELDQAATWRDRGKALLEEEGRKLIYDDGAFAQHSLNYHRLMLHDYIWALRLGDLHSTAFSSELRGRIDRAIEFLFQLQDDVSGEVPNYGHNDGALILPLNNCGYHDFRPVISAAWFLTRGVRTYGNGCWDEDMLWLFGPASLQATTQDVTRSNLRADVGGYYSIRSPEAFGFTRCGSFKHRPGHADMLHVDLWWRGRNIALDAGTLGYNLPAPWDMAFSDTAYHNTVTVDSMNQMERAGRFLWLPWLQGTMRRSELIGGMSYLEGEHDGYSHLPEPVIHRRAIISLAADVWVVLDRLESGGEHDYRLHWLLADLPYTFDPAARRLLLQTGQSSYLVQLGESSGTGDCTIVRAQGNGTRGWRSRYYGEKVPAISLAFTVKNKAATFWSIFSPQILEVTATQDILRIQKELMTTELRLSRELSANLVASIAVNGK